jgi:hypothetical protein
MRILSGCHLRAFAGLNAEPADAFRSSWQVSDHMDFGKEDTDEEKTAALSSILAIGEACKVKVVEVTFDER